MINKTLGRAGDRIVIQEKLVGKEVSVMVFSDGTRVAPIIATSDYKRLGDGNVGPNTGSMGSMAPSDNATPQQLKKIYQLLQYAVQCMKKEGRPYQGVLYAGLMIAEGKPYILEFNCRFGDPETEVQLPLLKSDLLSIVEACLNGSLSPRLVSFSNQTCVCVVLAAPGYPGHYLKNIQIVGLAKPHNNTVTVFHAGTSRSESTTITTGGRVLGITAWESSIEKARAQVYALIGKQISFNGMQYRTDIGL
jgi:phosphoribosylamine--glycine ligase